MRPIDCLMLRSLFCAAGSGTDIVLDCFSNGNPEKYFSDESANINRGSQGRRLIEIKSF